MNRIGFGLGLSLLLIPLVFALYGLIELSQGLPSSEPEEFMRDVIMLCVVLGFGSFLGYFGYLVVGYNFDALSTRPRWLYWVMLALGILWIPHLGIGTFVGLGLLVFTIRQRGKFDFGPSGVVPASMPGSPKVG